MHFGHKIIIAFVLFIAFIFTMVFAMVRAKVDLVKDDYYEDEATFRRNRSIYRNSVHLQKAFSVQTSELGDKVVLQFDSAMKNLGSGYVLFFRPSDKKLDFKIALNTNEHAQQLVDVQHLARGYWKVQVAFERSGQAYLLQQSFYLP